MRVLIVDDNSATVAFMLLAFEAAGDAVDTATTVDEALGIIALSPPDVVVSDLTFRRNARDSSDGFRLLDELRSSPDTSHIGVLLVSGADYPDVLSATTSRGVDGFIAKPVDVADLLDRAHCLGEAVNLRRS